MTPCGRAVLAVSVAFGLVLATAPAAWAHAALLRTAPQASGTVNGSPARITLTYNEAVEPRFAVISVTDAAGHQQIDGSPHTLPSDPATLAVPVKHLPPGWYLVYWRVISADGHPVRGAFTFAVGPNPGPAPQFVIPSLNETAATPQLVGARWAVFLSMMAAVGLFVFRAVIARRAANAAPAAVRAVSVALAAAVLTALAAIPLYVLVATAEFALRPATDLSALLPLVRDSTLGRAYTDLEVVTALFAAAALAVILIDRPDRPRRSIAELLALTGALLAGGALLAIPGLSGHAAHASPAGLSLALDWLHLAAGSIWFGGLLGLLLLTVRTPARTRLRVLGAVVPRFSRTALTAVATILATGVGASLLHLPTLQSLWQTGYGKAILVKAALLAAAMVLGGVNYARSTPRVVAAHGRGDQALGASAVGLLQRLVSVEAVLVAAILLAAMVLSSLPPPARALTEVGRASARVGPGPVSQTVHHGGYTLTLRISPNRAAAPSMFTLHLTRSGRPVTGAGVVAHFAMLDMEMGQQAYTLPETAPGTYQRSAPALVMVGHWGLSFDVEPPGAPMFTVIILDHAEG